MVRDGLRLLLLVLAIGLLVLTWATDNEMAYLALLVVGTCMFVAGVLPIERTHHQKPEAQPSDDGPIVRAVMLLIALVLAVAVVWDRTN
jgi:TRAP-type C4-dicarboxylate transport system permease large subunit